MKKVLLGLLIAAVIAGGTLSWFASSNSDGLEWAMFRASGKEELESHETVHSSLADIQEKTAFLPDYGFKKSELEAEHEASTKTHWPTVDSGTSVSGLVGGTLTLLIVVLIGLVYRKV